MVKVFSDPSFESRMGNILQHLPFHLSNAIDRWIYVVHRYDHRCIRNPVIHVGLTQYMIPHTLNGAEHMCSEICARPSSSVAFFVSSMFEQYSASMLTL